jgi:putative copper resistance protein D
MESLFAVTRAIHFVAAIGAFGELAFFLLIRSRAAALYSPIAGDSMPMRRVGELAGSWLGLAVLSGALWFVLEAANMSGLPIPQAAHRDTLMTVAVQTSFGRVWCFRCALAIALAIALLAGARRAAAQRTTVSVAFLLSAAFLASMAWTGHANAEEGAARLVHRTADALHLIAVGAWIGALLPLARRLGRARASIEPGELDALATAVHRFSALAVAAVVFVLVSGGVNAYFTVGSVAALLASLYGRLILFKLAGVAAMLTLAVVNRTRQTPRLAAGDAAAPARLAAAAHLRRNSLAEFALAVLVLSIVGVLGLTAPAMGH